MAARRDGSASTVIGTRNGPAMKAAKPESPAMARNSQPGAAKANTAQAAKNVAAQARNTGR